MMQDAIQQVKHKKKIMNCKNSIKFINKKFQFIGIQNFGEIQCYQIGREFQKVGNLFAQSPIHIQSCTLVFTNTTTLQLEQKAIQHLTLNDFGYN